MRRGIFDNYGEEPAEQKAQRMVSRELAFGALLLLSGVCGLLISASALSVVQTICGGLSVVAGVLKLKSSESNP